MIYTVCKSSKLCGKSISILSLSHTPSVYNITMNIFNNHLFCTLYVKRTSIINSPDTAFTRAPYIHTHTQSVIACRLTATGQQVLKVNENYSVIAL